MFQLADSGFSFSRLCMHCISKCVYLYIHDKCVYLYVHDKCVYLYIHVYLLISYII